MKEKNDRKIVTPSIKRLALYLNYLKHLSPEENEYVSSRQIAVEFGITSIQVRKDIGIAGFSGRPKIGFRLVELIDSIEIFLGWNNYTDAFIVGAGNMGQALMGFKEFKDYGLNIIGAFDSDDSKIGTKIKGYEIQSIAKLSDLIQRMHIKIGIITVPTDEAKQISEIMIKSGIQAIWNFTPVKLHVPDSVIVEDVRLTSSLSVLTNKLTKKQINR